MWRTKSRGLHADKGRRSSALILVLFFVVLLTAVTVAFLSRSMLARQVSNSSAGETKAALLANSAADIIAGDLKQEIVDGSYKSNYGVGYDVYYPRTAVAGAGKATVTPAISGFTPTYSPTTGLETDGMNNLLKRSAYGAWFYSTSTNSSYAQNGPIRASNSSSTNSSINGRVVSPARWNSHYLLSLADPTSTNTTTPTANFVAPDWVIVNRGGTSAPYSAYDTKLSDPTLSNTNYAVGRYAYAIYDEGGLLDMNAAGHPSGLTTTQISQKGSLALADLTVLPISSTNTASAMSQAQVDNFVGWRNYASAGLSSTSGAYGSVTFNAGSATSWLTNFASNNSNAFLKIVTPNGATTPPTDQALLSRQQLISLIQSFGKNVGDLKNIQNALQYMGTFSRGVEQPSFTPDPLRPTVINPGVTPPPAVAVPPSSVDVAYYAGNNDAIGGDNIINPSFLAIRVVSPFTRYDGSTAVVGEPLMKTKFPLSRLGLVTYTSTAVKSSSDPIYARFGIYRSSASSPWVYDHGIKNCSGGLIIGTLDKVAAAGREPDFAEVLKAAISVGSLAKGGPGLHNNQGNYQYVVDTAVDYQVLQIMANLIDQCDTDSYPTWIQITAGSGGSAVVRNFYGTEDLPYFYRYHVLSVVDQLPSTILGPSDAVTFAQNTISTNATPIHLWNTFGTNYNATTFPTGGAVTATWVVANTSACVYDHIRKGTLTGSAGEAAYLYIPDVWNPHDPNTLATSSNNRPSRFRIIAQTQDPVGASPWQIGASTNPNGSTAIIPTQSGSSTYVRPVFQSAPVSAFTSANTAMTFSDNNGLLFREPTMLWNSVNPSGASISSATSIVDAVTGRTYLGILAGKAPIQMQVSFASTPGTQAVPIPGTDGTYIVQGTSITNIAYLGSSYQQITFSLQYQDPNNASNWITYDSKYPDLHGIGDPTLILNTAEFSSGSWQSPFQNNQISGHASTMDPRTARWGVGTASTIGQGADRGGDYLLENTAHTFFSTNSTTGYLKVANSNPSVTETQKPRADLSNYVRYSNPGMSKDPGMNMTMRWFSGTGYSASGGSGDSNSPLDYDGLFSQNLPSINLIAKDNSTVAHLYVEDADGMARPAMGAYAYAYQNTDPLTTQDPSQSSLATSSAHRIGLPMATANAYSGDNGVGTATTQSQSRPMVLNRPFRSVSDMSYAFRGTPWKNIDFFTPASGDSALLDAFCVNELPSNAMVAGKIDLNTRQAPVIQAVVAGACRDEISVATAAPSSFTVPPSSGVLPPLTSLEAQNVASKLVAITTDTSNSWRGPIPNLSGVVGRFVAKPGTTTVTSASGATIGTDWYTYSPPVLAIATTPALAASYTYSGLVGALDTNVYSTVAGSATTSASTPLIQRFREAAIRPLVDAGQVRVWNVLIDVVAQTGRYPKSATGLDQFTVEGEKRIWLHLAIDRYTGQIIDKQVEVVAQ